MPKTLRLNRYYVAISKNDTLIISHSPRWLFYLANGEQFFALRRDAYRTLAMRLQDVSFRSDVQFVQTSSLVIDLARDTDQAARMPCGWFDKMLFLSIWSANVYNWHPVRLRKLVAHLRRKEQLVLKLERGAFAAQFGR